MAATCTSANDCWWFAEGTPKESHAKEGERELKHLAMGKENRESYHYLQCKWLLAGLLQVPLAHLEEHRRQAGVVVWHCACPEGLQVDRPEVIQEGGELREAAGGAEEDAENLPGGMIREWRKGRGGVHIN